MRRVLTKIPINHWEHHMSAKLFYRLIDAAAEKVYRTATVLGPAVGEAVFDGMSRAANVRQPENEWHGIPNLDATEHPMWEEAYGPNRRPW